MGREIMEHFKLLSDEKKLVIGTKKFTAASKLICLINLILIILLPVLLTILYAVELIDENIYNKLFIPSIAIILLIDVVIFFIVYIIGRKEELMLTDKAIHLYDKKEYVLKYNDVLDININKYTNTMIFKIKDCNNLLLCRVVSNSTLIKEVIDKVKSIDANK